MGRVYAVASGKGGVGKTTTTANLAAALAAADHDVAVVDTDLGMANLADALGVAPSSATLHDVLAGDATVTDATYEGAGGVSVVPGSNDLSVFAESDPVGLDDVLEDLSEYEFVLLDTGASLTHANVRPLAVADAVVLVSTTERVALRDTDKTRAVTRRVGGTVAGAVLTRVDPDSPNADEVAATLDADVLEAVPEDAATREAMAAGEPLAVHAPDSPAGEAYRGLVAPLSGDVGDESESDATGGDDADVVDAYVAPEPGDAPTGETPPESAAPAESNDPDASDRDEPPEAVDAGETDVPDDTTAADLDGDGIEGGVADEGDAPTTDDATDGDDEADDPGDAPSGVDDDPAAATESGASDGESDAPDASDTESDVDGDSGADHGADAAGRADEASDSDSVSETVLGGEEGGDLVEEAEPGEEIDRNDGSPSPDGARGSAVVPDAEADASESDDESGDEEERKGFFRRLLG